MIVKLIQTRANISSEYNVVSQNGEILYSATIPLNTKFSQIELYRNNAQIYTLNFNASESAKNIFRIGAKVKTLPFIINDSMGDSVGEIYSKYTKFFLGYPYFEILLDGHTYQAYRIGMGKEGLKIPIYEKECQVALVEKPTVVKDNKDEYEISALDPSSLELAVIFTIYFDVSNYGNRGEVVYKKTQVEYINTLNKELKSKYDPNFKERCI